MPTANSAQAKLQVRRRHPVRHSIHNLHDYFLIGGSPLRRQQLAQGIDDYQDEYDIDDKDDDSLIGETR